jgi:transposase
VRLGVDHVWVSDSPSVAELLELVARQAERIAQLEAEIAELKRQLGQNSSNSSRPPSADGLAKPAPKSLRRKSGKRPGGQAGHDGRTLSQVDSPDETIVHEPSACAGCGAGLATAAVASVVRWQVFDVPPISVRVVEHRLIARRCGCGAVTVAAAPAGVGAPVQYGPRTKAIVSYLMAGQFLAQARCAHAMADLFGIGLSEGTVAAMTAATAQDLHGFVDATRAAMRASQLVHVDETGLRVDGKVHWVHSSSTDRLSLIAVHEKRGRVGIDVHGVLPDYGGIVVHDAWRPYDCYTTATHALCNAHLLRDLQQVLDCYRQPDAGEAAWADQAVDSLIMLRDPAAAAAINGMAMDPARREHLCARFTSAAVDGMRHNRLRRTKIEARHNALAKRMLDRTGDYLRFAYDRRVPFTNNAAEREIRMIRLRQKVSGCMRTLAGACQFAAIRSYLATTAKNGLNALDALVQLAQGQPWMPATT